MKRLVIILTLALIPTMGLLARDFYWKGGAGNWTNPSMWELKDQKSVKGLFPTASDNVYIEQSDAYVLIDMDVAVKNLYWNSGALSGKAERIINVGGLLEVNASANDEFVGTWVLNTETHGEVRSAIKLAGSLDIKAQGEVLLNEDLSLEGDFTISEGSISLNNMNLECNNFVLTESGKQSILFDNSKVRLNRIKTSKNSDRYVRNNGFKIEKIEQNSSKALSLSHSLRHWCDGTQAQISISATATTKYIRFLLTWYDYNFGDDKETYTFQGNFTASGVYNYSFPDDPSDPENTLGYLEVTVQHFTTSNWSSTPAGADYFYPEFYKLGDLTLGTHTISDETIAGNDGQIVVAASGGTKDHAVEPHPLSYTLSPGGTQSNATFGGLAAGLYNLTVSNSEFSTCPDVTETGIEVKGVSFTLDNVVGTNETTCSNSDDGTITFTVSNANGTPEFSIDGGTTWHLSNVFDPVEAGLYDCRAKDDDGEKTWPGGITITQPADIAVNGVPTITNVSTTGGNDGRIQVSGTGPNMPLTYTITGGTSNNDGDFTNLIAGSYTVTISDASSCPTATTAVMNVTEPALPFTLDNVVGTNETTCSNSDDGTITFTVSNANGTPEFSIDGGTTWHLSNVFDPVEAGLYDCRAKDDDGEKTWPGGITITQPADIAVNGVPTITNVSINGGNDGRIQVSGTGPNMPLTYTITGGATNNDGDFTNLIAGDYTVTISDASGCPTAITGLLTVTEPAISFTINNVVGTNETICSNSDDGTITFTVSNENGIPEFSIDGGTTWQLSNVFDPVEAGSYDCRAKDDDGEKTWPG
ncbi:MAG: SprB repeat-containing protein, partial [Salinivirgaceae bacterium]|nr:SprB repeat-containing protein [Salinivirgaceae bacterium]